MYGPGYSFAVGQVTMEHLASLQKSDTFFAVTLQIHAKAFHWLKITGNCGYCFAELHRKDSH